MNTTAQFPFETLRHAIETSNFDALVDLYSQDALYRIVDRRNPPSKPLELRGKPAIAAYLEDVCARAMTHKLEDQLQDGNKLAFTEACEYPDGTRVFCAAVLELNNGKITRQTNVQAWDE